MRIDAIQLPDIETKSNLNKDKISTNTNSSKEKDFSNALSDAKEKDAKSISKNEKTELSKAKVENKTLSQEDNINKDSELSEVEVELIAEVLYPIVVEFIRTYNNELESLSFNNSNSEFNVSTTVNGNRQITWDNKLEPLISEFVQYLEIPSILEEKTSLKESFINFFEINMPSEELFNKENVVNKETLFNIDNKSYDKAIVKEVLKEVVNQFENAEIKNLDYESTDELKETIKWVVKDIVEKKEPLNKGVKEYIPVKNIYLKESEKDLIVKVTEVETKDNKALLLSSSDEDMFLKSLIEGEEKTTKVDLMFKTDNKNFTDIIQGKSIEETPIINKKTMVEDIIKAIKYMERNAQKELTVKIYPKELGEISIKIVEAVGEAGIKANITATSKETYSILTANINELKQSIANSEIKISEVNISLYNQDTTFHRDETNKNYGNESNSRSRNNENNHDIEEIDEMQKESNPLGNLSMLV